MTVQRTLKLALVLGPQELALGLKKGQLYQAERPYRQNMKKMDHRTLPNTAASLLFATLLWCFSARKLSLIFTPPISRDALIHHLAVPKLWLKHGRFYEIPWADYCLLPDVCQSSLYLSASILRMTWLRNLFTLPLALAPAVLIFFYLKEKLDRNWGLLGMVIFITTPIMSLVVYIGIYRFGNDLFYYRECPGIYKVA